MHLLGGCSRRRLFLVTALVAVFIGIVSGVAFGGNYDTFYCGDTYSDCTLGSGSYASTSGVAQRDWNEVTCETGCHTHVWYDNGGGAYDIQHTDGGNWTEIGASSGNAYARCETDSGYGTNQAECDTYWHT